MDYQAAMPVTVSDGKQELAFIHMSKRDYFALEFTKQFIELDWENPVLEGIRYADILIKKLEQK